MLSLWIEWILPMTCSLNKLLFITYYSFLSLKSVDAQPVTRHYYIIGLMDTAQQILEKEYILSMRAETIRLLK